MLNVIQTIRNLKEKFPRFQLDTILQIVECIGEDKQTEDGLLIQPKKQITGTSYKVLNKDELTKS